jgi:protein O-GlcNAc transferase
VAIEKFDATDEAVVKSCLDAVTRDPKDPKNWRNLADAHWLRRQLREAILAYSQVTRLDSNDGMAWLRTAEAQERLGMIDEAVVSYRQAISLRPNDGNAHLMAAVAMPRIMLSEDQIIEFRRAMAIKLASIIVENRKLDGSPPLRGSGDFYCAYHNRNDRHLRSLLARAHLSVFPDLEWRARHCSSPFELGHSARIRLGVASNFLYANHTIGKLNLGLIERICRNKFEVIIIRRVPSRPRDYAQIDAAADHVVILPDDLNRARQLIADLKLDVLHYPDVGMSEFCYRLAFARLAPVQSASWGHPDTTGIPNIDYFISSRCLEPSDSAHHYSERLILLDGPPTCYRRPLPPAKTTDRRNFGLPEGGALYACPHTLFRLHPDFDEILGVLLRRDSEAHLVLISDDFPTFLTRLLLRRFSQSIPDVVDRIIFLPRVSENWLNFLRVVDCVLDPHTFSGGNTSYEALAMGTPVVTWANAPYMRGRITLALYRMLGVAHCIAHSPDQYVEIARRLAHDPDWRRQVVQSIEDRSFLIFDEGSVEMVRSLETFWESAVRENMTGHEH